VEQQLQAVATILSLVNPAICGVLFAQAEAGSSRRKQLADATKAAVAILAILLGAALAGTRVLDMFGVSLDAFMVAGGGVLAWMGFSMLSGKGSIASSSAAGSDSTPSLTP
jgi:multiple antibiotic resistance protein